MFHQPHNTFGSHIYNAALYTDMAWPAHFHKSFELLYAQQGNSEILVREKPYLVREGEFCMVFPYESHSFSVGPEQKLFVAVFSGEYVPELWKRAQKESPVTPVFQIDEELCRFLQTRFLRVKTPDAYTLRASLYLLAGAFLAGAEFVPKQKADDLVLSIIRYIEEHYTEPITERSMAAALGYHEQYISRVFRTALQMNFRDLVNQYRLEDALARLAAGGITVTQAALDSGFQSVRTFNRVLRARET